MNQEEIKLLKNLTDIVEEHLSNEEFNVDQLAREYGNSRSHLHRRLKKIIGVSASTFIRKIRLSHSKVLLEKGDLNISEVAFKVGYSNVSYFTKCFKKYYGFPPSDIIRRIKKEDQWNINPFRAFINSVQRLQMDVRRNDKSWLDPTNTKRQAKKYITITVFVLCLVIVIVFTFENFTESQVETREKSIAVLPFKNDSQDDANKYFSDGMMESILNHLTKINDLHVKSRTDVERFRTTNLSLTEISEILGVNNIIEGSVNKHGSKYKVSIQLIDTKNGFHIWSDVYKGDYNEEIFARQSEIAHKIAYKINASITPQEAKQINQKPSIKIEAYDYNLKGQQWLTTYKSTFNKEQLIHAEECFNTSFSISPNIPETYIGLAKVQLEKGNLELMHNYALKSTQINPHFAEGHVIQGQYHYLKGAAQKAIQELNKSLEINPTDQAYLYLGLTYCNLLSEFEKGLFYLNKKEIISLINNDEDISLLVAQIYINIGDYEAASKYINNLNQCRSDFMNSIIFVLNNNLSGLRSFTNTSVGVTGCKSISSFNNFMLSFFGEEYENCEEHYIQWKSVKNKSAEIFNMNTDLSWIFASIKLGKSETYSYQLDDIRNRAEQLLIEGNGMAEYVLARICAIENKNEKSIFHLKELEKYGFRNGYHDVILIDPIFKKIRDNTEFQELLTRVHKEKSDLRESLAQL